MMGGPPGEWWVVPARSGGFPRTQKIEQKTQEKLISLIFWDHFGDIFAIIFGAISRPFWAPFLGHFGFCRSPFGPV